ncbi:CDT1-C domain-containing protein [Favolaschia claudopus]|uniref:CDT1-C domain-containing protein n=1 Tax=Favolaschia claudopus TaxID=2862362 RepID=A0AAW0ASY1_9AGAR
MSGPSNKRRCVELSYDRSCKKVRSASGSPAPTEDSPCFPLSLLRLEAVYTELNRALCHALATSPVSPDPNTGTVLNILDHMSLERHYLSCLRIDDLRRLCWICEWDTEDPSLEATASVEEVDNDDPFLPIPNDWIRGAMGITISPTTHRLENGKRLPAYGVGIRVRTLCRREEVKKKVLVGMTAVAQWVAASENRREAFHANFAQRLLSSSPSAVTMVESCSIASLGLTPDRQRVSGASRSGGTPSTPRREALYSRLRQRSVSVSPTKTVIDGRGCQGVQVSSDQPAKARRAKLRRRVLLSRLERVAEVVWMTFSTASTGSALSNTNHTRRALPLSVVATAVHKSSSAPISATEVLDSLTMLADLCPWFLKHLEIGAEKWLEMPGRSGDASQAPGEPKGAHEHGLRRARGIIRRNLLDVDF